MVNDLQNFSILTMIVHVYNMYVGAMEHMWRPEDTFLELFLFFCSYMGSGITHKLLGLHGECFPH